MDRRDFILTSISGAFGGIVGHQLSKTDISKLDKDKLQVEVTNLKAIEREYWNSKFIQSEFTNNSDKILTQVKVDMLFHENNNLIYKNSTYYEIVKSGETVNLKEQDYITEDRFKQVDNFIYMISGKYQKNGEWKKFDKMREVEFNTGEYL